VFCNKCGTDLPDASQFCLNCGQAMTIAAPDVDPAAPIDLRIPARARKSRPALWLMAVMLPAIAWIVFSNSVAAQQIRDFVTMAHVETITDTDIAMKPHGLSSFKFTVPAGAIHAFVTGEFSVAGTSKSPVQAAILTDEAFTAWQSGYATDTYYDSGNALSGTINATLPSGAGTYYLVFKDSSSTRTAKTIHSAVTLHYQRWFPEWILHLLAKDDLQSL
jgi:hypothetical protein